MRELRFRAWSTSTKKMYRLNPRGNKTRPSGALSDLAPSETWKVMQFTGLKDDEGFDIYEGDIVTDHIGRGEVEYSDKYAGFRVNYKNGRCKWFYDYNLRGERESIKVVGNVFET